ncbi:ADP,ATP carrier protein 1, mitochondrial-like [Pistacia vera]|uniref:ADP,ATP carrier protein 1, mitochondrial-like n=1 Tax=Pistacia vera TaxID=55513 RepID=UPI00126339E8|nr:ADP,ATP carrier protein 1, mitochondrial-like [Pistacia vera]
MASLAIALDANPTRRRVHSEELRRLGGDQTSAQMDQGALDKADRPLKHKQDKDEFLKRFARKVAVISIDAGAFHYLLYPLLYAHIRLATDMINITSVGVSKRQFSGLIDVCRKTIKTDGIIGLYRGCNILYVKYWLDIAAMHGLVSIMPKFIELLGSQYYSWRPEVVAPVIVTSAWVVTYPLDTIHCRMVMRSGEAVKYKSSFDAFSQTLKTEGVRSLYKGASLLILKNTALGLGFVLGSFSYLEHK